MLLVEFFKEKSCLISKKPRIVSMFKNKKTKNKKQTYFQSFDRRKVIKNYNFNVLTFYSSFKRVCQS